MSAARLPRLPRKLRALRCMHCSLQAELLRAVSGTSRGKNTTAAQRASILDIIVRLEALNKVKDPALSPLLSGVWALLYLRGKALSAG